MSDQASFDDAKHPYMLHSNMGSIQPKTPFLQKYAGPLTLMGGACVHLVKTFSIKLLNHLSGAWHILFMGSNRSLRSFLFERI